MGLACPFPSTLCHPIVWLFIRDLLDVDDCAHNVQHVARFSLINLFLKVWWSTGFFWSSKSILDFMAPIAVALFLDAGATQQFAWSHLGFQRVEWSFSKIAENRWRRPPTMQCNCSAVYSQVCVPSGSSDPESVSGEPKECLRRDGLVIAFDHLTYQVVHMVLWQCLPFWVREEW